MSPLIVVSCLKQHILQISIKPVSIPMVLCFLPGTRPASVMFCMISACCYTWAIMLVWLDMLCQYCVSAHCHLNASVFFFCCCFFYVWDICVGFCQLVVLCCTSAVLGSIYVICCNPVCWYTEGKHMLFALSASVPPSALGRLQVYSHRLWILLHIQHHRLPHWLWNSVPAGEL